MRKSGKGLDPDSLLKELSYVAVQKLEYGGLFPDPANCRRLATYWRATWINTACVDKYSGK